MENVVNTALAWGVAYALFWETYDNECTGGVGCSANRCSDPKHPVTDPKRLHGFWLTRPDGSHSWPYQYLKGKIAEADHGSEGCGLVLQRACAGTAPGEPCEVCAGRRQRTLKLAGCTDARIREFCEASVLV
eukprot:COSAG04_NODE_745_length_10645_cov_3.473639_4_plen_132_part_00